MEETLNLLFEKYLSNKCSDQDILLLLEYFKIKEQEPMLHKLIVEELQREDERNIPTNGIDERLDDAYQNIKWFIDQQQQEPAVTVKVKLWPRIAGIAAAAALMVMGVWFYKTPSALEASRTNVVYIKDISPGKQGATLALGNGKKIVLSGAANGELAKEAGVIITKTANGQVVYKITASGEAESGKINTLSTAKGETYALTLPDGTKVWLNAASDLTYSTNLMENGIRSVKLTGEAYFEVSKDKLHPFIVESKGQKVEVLGTHFNIQGYADDPSVKTTLLEGRVQVNDKMILSPGQQSVLKGGQLFKAEGVNIEDVMAWKQGKFSFDNKSFKEVMSELARWYNLEVIYEDDIPVNGNFFGGADRSSSLSLVLRLLESAGVKYRITADRKLIISYQAGQ